MPPRSNGELPLVLCNGNDEDDEWREYLVGGPLARFASHLMFSNHLGEGAETTAIRESGVRVASGL